MKKIIKIDLSIGNYGGRVYENEVIKALDRRIEFDRLFLLKYRWKILNIPRLIFYFIKFRFFFKGTLFLNDHTTWLAGKSSSNFIIIHHIDNSYSPWISKIYQKFNFLFLKINRELFQKTVVVSNYWKTKLSEIGFENVQVIYNSIEINQFNISEKEINQFKQKHFPENLPILYIGNAQKKKGALEVYKSLNELNCYFVTSGKSQIATPFINLELSYKDYLILLSISDVVITMSMFLEGWNRTAHEATIIGSVVIGSGKGGMRELLEKSNQIVCTSFSDLKKIVIEVLHHPDTRQIQKDFLKTLNKEYFTRKWLQIFNGYD